MSAGRTGEVPRAPLAVRTYRVLLMACPPAFRRRFGSSMLQGFQDRHTAAVRRGVPAVRRLLAAAYADALITACALWGRAFRDRVLWPDPLTTHQPNRRPEMWWQSLVTDMRYAARMFRRTPVFTALGVLALALGIGANTAIFSVVDGVLLRPLPYAHPDRLVMLWSTNAQEHRDKDTVSAPDFEDFQKASSFSSMGAGYSFLVATTWTTPAGAEQMVVTAVTPGLFQALGRAPLLGRPFSASDQASGIVVSYNFWRAKLGGDPAVLGRVLTIDFQPRTIVGVMPRDFVFPYASMLGPWGFARAQDVDAWLPLAFTDHNTRETGMAPLMRGIRMLTVVGRLNDGVTVDQARAEVQGIARQLSGQYPDTNRNVGAAVVPVHEQAVGSLEPALLVLLGGVGLVLLMACVNLANMLLARSSARQKELAVRAALGAGRGRIVAQTLVESVMLAGAGGVVAVAVLSVSLRALVAFAPPEIPRLDEIRPDVTLVLFAAALSLATGILIGLVPAFAASRANVNASLRQSGRGATAGPLQQRVRAALVVVEAALAVVLTIGAGLLLRSFTSLLSVDPGFRPEHVLTLQIGVPPKYLSIDKRRAFYADLESRLKNISGVTAVGGTTRLPLGSTNVTTKLVIEGQSMVPADWPEVEFRRAVFDYFGAMGIPILRGRGFSATDGPNAPPVCVVNETLTRRLFGAEDPVGRHVKFGGTEGRWSTIVGVIGDIRHAALSAPPAPEVYIYYLPSPPVNPFLVLRTAGNPAASIPAVRTQLSALDKNIVANDIRPMTGVIADSVAERRFILLLAGSFGLLALVMAAVGVYGVMSLVVGERAPEMAIRLALGADPSRVLRLIVRDGVWLASLGIVAGTAVAALVAPTLRSQLFAIRPSDPLTFVAVPLLVLATAVLACVVPARRSMRIDPAGALRGE